MIPPGCSALSRSCSAGVRSSKATGPISPPALFEVESEPSVTSFTKSSPATARERSASIFARDVASSDTLNMLWPRCDVVVTLTRISRSVTVSGTIAADRTITGVTATVGGVDAGTVTFTQTSFSIAITLGNNANAITITATDAAAATGSDSLDLDYPFVALSTFASATLVLGQSTFTASASGTYRYRLVMEDLCGNYQSSGEYTFTK